MVNETKGSACLFIEISSRLVIHYKHNLDSKVQRKYNSFICILKIINDSLCTFCWFIHGLVFWKKC